MSRRPTPPLLATLVALGCAAAPGVTGCLADLSLYGHDCLDFADCEDPCPGECVPLAPLGFDGPALLWIGPSAEVPACPARASLPVYEGYADLNDASPCEACECTAPACALPAEITASTAGCNLGGTTTAISTPEYWAGGCAPVNPGPPDPFASLTIAPVTVRSCRPVEPEVPQIASRASWSTAAKACAGEAIPNVCGDNTLTCLPSAEPPPSGFRQCVLYLRDGDPECPATYPEKHTFYERVEDTRVCTPCECTETQPSTCVAQVSAYQSATCAAPLFENVPVSDEPVCIDIGMPGLELGSVKAEWLTNAPGACVPSGGALLGEVKPAMPSTFCCQPPR
ncbi:MAG: hypothetical protein IT372_25355 [Polyangiaceae bacterium]|nr:hypothetical protein [Polyangiaceae bacterium]